MSDKMPEPVANTIASMKAEILVLRHVVSFLCANTVPSDTLHRYIERLETPITGDTPEVTKIVHQAIEEFLGQLSKER